MYFKTRRAGASLAAVAMLAGLLVSGARPAVATDAAITDAMLDAYTGARAPSPVALSIFSPLGPLGIAWVAARKARIVVLEEQIRKLKAEQKFFRAKVRFLRKLHNVQKAARAGAPVSKDVEEELRNEGAKYLLDLDELANPKRAARSIEGHIEKQQKQIGSYESQLNRLVAPKAASNGSANFTQAALSSLVSGQSTLNRFNSNYGQTRALSLNGNPALGAAPGADDLSDLSSPVRVLSGISHVDYDQNKTARRKGHVTTVWTGAHYTLSDTQAAGLYGTYRAGDARLSIFGSSLESDSFGIGGYFTSVLAGELTGSLQFEYNSGHHDIRIGGVTGDFNTNEIAIQGEIKRRFQLTPSAVRPDDFLDFAWYEPMAALSFSHVSRESYRLSNGFAVSSSDLDRARLVVGPRFGTTVLGDGENVNLVEPFLNVQGIWDFVNEGNLLVAAGTTVKTPDIGGQVGGGVAISFMNNAAIRLESHYAIFENGFDAWSISGSASMPLAVLGLLGPGHAGLVSFQVNALPTSSSAMLRVNLPLN